MNVLHILTWVAPGNPFGGPVSVAVNTSEELRRRGHHVEIVAARPRGGDQDGPAEFEAFTGLFAGLHLFPAAGFSGIVSPTLLWWVANNARRFDIVHVHLCRDLITLPAARIVEARGGKVVVQTHGMIDSSSRRSAALLDRVLTRQVLLRSKAALALTQTEVNLVRQAIEVPPSRFVVVPNGVQIAQNQREPGDEPPEALFCSRLADRKRPMEFVKAAQALIAEGLHAQFSVVGPDEGLGQSVDETIALIRSELIRREPALERTTVPDRVARASILVLPSIDEPYPMIVLEAMSLGRPAIVTDSCGLAPFITEHEAGLVIRGDDSEQLTDAMRRLLTDPVERARLGDNARSAVVAHLSIEKIVDQIEAVYLSES